jgi:ACS family hexuronate transporter-like MFS transporter
MPRPLRHLRWYIAGLLFVATVINYLDRQVFGILAPDLQKDMGWTELDYGRMVVAFQIAYAVMMMVSGGLLDRIGTRLGYALSVLVWSIAEIGHAFARTALGFGIARFFLGSAEAGNFPIAVKTVAEWFPASERALAAGLFNSGVALGSIVAPLTVPFIARAYGPRAAFVATGVVGLLWIPAWLSLYRPRRSHPRLSAEERAYIEDGLPETPIARVSWRYLFTLRQTWTFAVLKCLADPIWWFYLFWLPKLLASEFGIRGVAVAPYLTTVYIGADLGCLVGGWVSGVFVRRGWSVNRARKTTLACLAGIAVPSVIAVTRAHDPVTAIALITLACGAHQAWSTILYTIASDLIPNEAAASVTGIGGFVAGIVSTATAELTGRVLNVNPTLYQPMFLVAAALYPIGLVVFHVMSPRMERARLVESTQVN